MSPRTKVVSSLEGFNALGNGIYVSRTLRNRAEEDVRAPNIVLIFGWMAAQLSHLQKYTKIYTTLYPDATVLLVRNEPGFFFSREATRLANLKPICDVLEAEGCIPGKTKIAEPTSRPRILVHSFSNGGASQLVTLAKLLQLRGLSPSSYTPETRPISAMVIDSSPANGTIQTGIQAFTAHIRSTFLRLPIRILLTLFLYVKLFFDKLTGTPPPFEKMKTALNRPSLLPWMDAITPRLYLYSHADQLVPSWEVQQHVDRAKEVGLNVKNEVFETAPHVALARTEPERYWGAVKDTWESALKTAFS